MTTEYSILDVPVAQLTYDGTMDWIAARQRHSSSCGASLIFANVHVVTEAALYPEFRRALDEADLILPDGMPLVWASRLQGSPLKVRCYGPEFMARALARSEVNGWTHFFYGSTPEVLDALANAVSRRWPKARVVGSLAAPFGPFDDALELANIETINRSGADLVWIGLGCPRQELWLAKYRKRVRSIATMGIGAGFDFIAGSKAQAPLWMQRAGLEWLFRLCSEPRRLGRRYLIRNPYFVMQFALQLAGIRWRSPR